MHMHSCVFLCMCVFGRLCSSLCHKAKTQRTRRCIGEVQQTPENELLYWLIAMHRLPYFEIAKLSAQASVQRNEKGVA